ncbi:MAG: serine/threonine protein kinase [Myxococcales bacterium]|nr:serine/threonine protein kinase [Myxococcales bacterium]
MKLCPLCESEFDDSFVRCPHDNERLVQLPDKANDPLLGTVLNGRYRLEERIGEGGMGAVYRGVQEPVGRQVAIKVLRPELASDREAVRRFFNEARVVSKLRHPNTVTLYDFGQSDAGDLFIAMEFLSGRSLDRIMRSGELSLPEVLEVVDQVALSLEEAHSHGIIHRDLKPDNVFIDRVGNGNLVKVLDFGIAKVNEPDGGTSRELTQAGVVYGTPEYLSPEQAQAHPLDQRSDLYSIGVVLWELLAGELPFQGPNAMAVLVKHAFEPTPDPNTMGVPLSEPMKEILRKALAKSREERFQSAEEFLAALDRCEFRLEQDSLATAAVKTTVWMPPDDFVEKSDRPRPPMPMPSSAPGETRVTQPSSTAGRRDVLTLIIVGCVLLLAMGVAFLVITSN